MVSVGEGFGLRGWYDVGEVEVLWAFVQMKSRLLSTRLVFEIS
jgi:hypothetical protein